MAFTKTAGVEYGTPAVTLSTTAAEGSNQTAIRTDGQLIAFDTSNPANVTLGSASTGSAAVAARRDHVHSAEGAIGDVDGPGSAVDNALVRFNGTTGKSIQAYTSLSPTASDDGLVLTPGQPAFLAYNGSTVTNVTGNNTQYTGVFGTEVFDQASNYNGSTTFTAPVTARYRLSASVGMQGVTASGTRGRIRLVTSNRTYEYYWNPGAQEATTDAISCCVIDALADMDASDTAYITVLINGEGSDVCDWGGSSELFTYFQGELVA